jgi:hypothetical protein
MPSRRSGEKGEARLRVLLEEIGIGVAQSFGFFTAEDAEERRGPQGKIWRWLMPLWRKTRLVLFFLLLPQSSASLRVLCGKNAFHFTFCAHGTIGILGKHTDNELLM